MSLRCAVPVFWGVAAKIKSTSGPGRGRLLDCLVGMLLNNIHFTLDCFEFVSIDLVGKDLTDH